MATTTKSAWLDETSSSPVIAENAKRLESFLQAIADGKVTDEEVKTQESRVVKLMKAIEPQLDPKLHEQVTQFLRQVTAYEMMQSLNMMQSARPVTKFRG